MPISMEMIRSLSRFPMDPLMVWIIFAVEAINDPRLLERMRSMVPKMNLSLLNLNIAIQTETN